MVKALFRSAAVFIAVFLVLSAGLFVTTAEDAFPLDADYSVNLDFGQSTVSRSEAIGELRRISDETDSIVAKVVPDPKHFYAVRDLYVFGSDNAPGLGAVGWFAPGLKGEIRSASTLGDVSLNGPYALRGSSRAIADLSTWSDRHGVVTNVTSRSNAALLQAGLLSTGAWLALVTGLVLVVSLVITWYSVRARQRALRVVSGESRAGVLWGDLRELLLAFVPPLFFTLVVSTAVVWGWRGSRAASGFLEPLLILSACVLAVVVAAGLLVGRVSFPRVDSIASRQPAEKPFRAASEILRLVAIVLTLVFLPTVGSSAENALALSSDNARWAPLAEDVSVRLAPLAESAVQQSMAGFGELATAADDRKALLFSYKLDEVPGFDASEGRDGVALVNLKYLHDMLGPLGIDSTHRHPLGDAGQEIGFHDLPSGAASTLREEFALWSRDPDAADPLPPGTRLFRYTGPVSFPVIDPVGGGLSLLTHPLVVVIDNPGEAFDDDFLTSVMSTSNILFSDSPWLDAHLATHDVGRAVSFVDRVADVALNRSQDARRQALATGASMAIIVLALLLATVVATRIRALITGRRLFVLRTNGWRWTRILRRRLIAELAILALLTALAGLLAGGGSAWILLAFPFYGIASAVFHIRQSRSVVEHIAARRM
jgi:hypothetical protein